MLASDHTRTFITCSLTALLLAGSFGCEQLPGTPGEQGAAIGGVGGAATGAVVAGSHHRLLGALLGGALGAGGGYLIGANKDKITGKDKSAADQAVHKAQTNPATPQEALKAPTADLNNDGFVTMDEVVAMKRAGLSDQQMVSKLQATGQVFELNPQAQDYLRSNGVDQYVIDQMEQLNRDTRNHLLQQQGATPTTPNPAPTYTPPASSSSTPVPPPPGP